jgi:hypothetical protein
MARVFYRGNYFVWVQRHINALRAEVLFRKKLTCHVLQLDIIPLISGASEINRELSPESWPRSLMHCKN